MKKLICLAILLFAVTARAQTPVPIVSGVVNIDTSSGSAFKVTLIGNVSSVKLTNPRPGQVITILFTQDATGGRTVAFGGNISNTPTITSTASASTLTIFGFDSSSNSWFGSSGSGGGSPTGAAGGDLAGTYPNPTIATTGSTAASCGDATHSCSLTVNTKGQITANSNNSISASPTGTAGGDLSGTYPNPTVSAVNGTSIPANPSVGQIATATSGTTATYQYPALAANNVIDAASPQYGMKWDSNQISTASITSGSANISSSVAAFSAADIGKVIYGFKSCNTDTAAQSTLMPRTTIITFTDSTHIVANTTATGTQASTACIVWGTPDDTGLIAVEAAALASPTCPVIQFPAKGTLLETPPHFTQTLTTCSKSPAGVGQPAVAWGEVIQGWGMAATILNLSPSFATNATAGNCNGGATGLACLFGQQGQNLKGFQISGGGNLNANFTASQNVVEMGSYSAATDVGFYNFGTNGANVKFRMYGIGEVALINSVIDQFGQVVTGGASTLGGAYHIVNSAIQDFCLGSITLNSGGAWNSYGSYYAAGSCAPTNLTLINNAGGTVNSYGDLFFTDLSTTRNYGIQNTNAAAISNVNGTVFLLTNAAGGLDMFNNAAGAVFNVQNTQMTAGSADFGIYNNVSGAIANDLGGNKLIQGTVGGVTGGIINGVASIVGKATNTSVASTNAAVTTTNLLATTASWSGANYGIVVKLNAWDSSAGSGCIANTTITWTIGYTDPTSTAQTQTATQTITNNGGTTGGDKLATVFTLPVKGGTAVTYATAYSAGTGCTTNPGYAAQLAVQ